MILPREPATGKSESLIASARPANQDSERVAWQKSAADLANWAAKHVANRTDAWGQYLPLGQRTERRHAVTKKGKLNHKILAQHFAGRDQGDLIGLHTTSSDNTSRALTVDIDQHGAPDKTRHHANRKAAIRLYDRARDLGFTPLLISSNGRGGYHLLILFDPPTSAEEAQRFGQWLTRDWKELGLAAAPEVFPKQPRLGNKTPLGSWVRLPGRHHTLPYYSRVWDGNRWLKGAAAIRCLLDTRGRPSKLIPREAQKYTVPETGTLTETKQTERRGWSRPPTERPIDKVLACLQNVRGCGNQWSARCPAHGRRPALGLQRAMVRVAERLPGVLGMR